MPYKKRTESQLTSACLNWLMCQENIGNIAWVDRINSGSIVERRGKKTYRIRLARPGTADIYVRLNDGKTIWLETKNDYGKQTSDQVAFMKKMEAIGDEYFIIRDLDELVRIFRSHGIG